MVFLFLTYYIERALHILHANRRSLTFKKHDNMAFTDASTRMKGKSPTVPNQFGRSYEKLLSDTEVERKKIWKFTPDFMAVIGMSGVDISERLRWLINQDVDALNIFDLAYNIFVASGSDFVEIPLPVHLTEKYDIKSFTITREGEITSIK